jgi:hypothetical protein
MSVHSFSIKSETIRPGIEAVARYFGGCSYTPDDRTQQRIQLAIDHADKIVSPIAAFIITPVLSADSDGMITLSNEISLPLPNGVCHGSACFLSAAIGTLGTELETTCRQMAATHHIYESTLLDAVGTAMLDILENKIRNKITDTCRPMELSIGARFAPGLNGYAMEHQQTLFELVDGSTLHIRINEAFMMEPVKSISFFALLGRDEMSVHHPDKCFGCRMSACLFRKQPDFESTDMMFRSFFL